MTSISYQLYCSRNFPPLEDTLSMLAGIGFKEVEGFGGLYGDPAKLRDQLDAAGLTMTSGHFGLDMVEGDPAGAIAAAKTIGVGKLYIPHIGPDQRPGDLEGWRAFAARLVEVLKPVSDAGITTGWHNHAFELDDLGGGTTPLDLFYDAGLGLELDLGWVKVAGHDPAAAIAKYADRLSAVHVKDIAPEGEAKDEDGWADVGHGIMDWAAIKAALDAANVSHFVIEHDNPKDHERLARRSFATVSSW